MQLVDIHDRNLAPEQQGRKIGMVEIVDTRELACGAPANTNPLMLALQILTVGCSEARPSGRYSYARLALRKI